MAQDTRPTIIPYFDYHDGMAALKWHADAFGFEQIATYIGPDGNILHAEMRFGTATIMLGTATAEQRIQMPWDLPADRGIYLYIEDLAPTTSEPEPPVPTSSTHPKTWNSALAATAPSTSTATNGASAPTGHHWHHKTRCSWFVPVILREAKNERRRTIEDHINPCRTHNSAFSIEPPAAPRIVLCPSATNL